MSQDIEHTTNPGGGARRVSAATSSTQSPWNTAIQPRSSGDSKKAGPCGGYFPGYARCAPDRRELFRSRGCVSPGPHAPAAAAGLRWSQRHSRWTMSS